MYPCGFCVMGIRPGSLVDRKPVVFHRGSNTVLIHDGRFVDHGDRVSLFVNLDIAYSLHVG